MPENLNIEHKQIPETLAVMRRLAVKQRDDLQLALLKLAEQIPEDIISGPAFAIFWSVTHVKEGFDVEAGYPVSQWFRNGDLQARMIPALDVLSVMHTGAASEVRETAIKLYKFASDHAIISDEFRREVYRDDNDPKGSSIEVQFVIHNWNDRLARNLERVMGTDGIHTIMPGCGALDIESSPDERFQWTKGAMERLEALATSDQVYDVVSSCAHVFPPAQVERLRVIFNQASQAGFPGLQAVDAVIDFMGQDPGCWGERPRREGRIIHSAKNPRDPDGYAKAKNALERRRAYCFCPLLRNHMDQGMPLTFCNCGAGWYRQQWEGATGKPVRIEIVQSVSKGDEVCEFAIHLPDDL